MNKAYQKITDTIIELLEKGVCPWRKPWVLGSNNPVNYQSKRAYSGINHLMLSVMSDNPYWLTFNQIKKMNGKLNKGSKGVPVVYWNMVKIKDKITGDEEIIPYLKYYTVFSIADTDIEFNLPEVSKFSFNPSKHAEQIVTNWQEKPKIEEKYGDRACYSSFKDVVTMPRRTQFEDSNKYYSVLFHELGHSTGHRSRLNRKLGNKFGSKDYALEELTAEMTAAFCCAECGIDNSTIDNSASYLKGWISTLKQDSKILISAASKAQKAANLILNKDEEQKEKKVA